MGGAALRCAPLGDGDDTSSVVVTLPSGADAEGVLLLELAGAGGARAVLVTRHADVAEELCSLEGLWLEDDAVSDNLEAALPLLGAALRSDASVDALADAAAAAVRLALPATLRRVAASLAVRCTAAPAAANASFEAHLLALLRVAHEARQPAMLHLLVASHDAAARGVALARALLRAAEDDGHAVPQLALASAQEALAARCFAGAAAFPDQILRSAAAALSARAAATGAAPNAPRQATEAGFARYLAGLNLSTWRATALLTLFVNATHCYLWLFFVRAQASPTALLVRGAALRKQIKHTRLYDPAAPHDAPLCLLDLPWADVVAAAPVYIAALAAVRMPTHAAILLFSSSKRLRPFTMSASLRC
jgi:hypothetical protein